MGVKSSTLADWIFVDSVADELLGMLRDSDYTDALNEYSYFAYQADFRLVTKSAYSSVTNPGIFFWLHMAGLLLGSKRSQMARKNTYENINNLAANAVIMAYAHKKNLTLCKPFTIDGEELGNNDAKEELRM